MKHLFRKPLGRTGIHGVLAVFVLAATLVLGQVGIAFADDRDDDAIRVMTRNLYQGANLDPLIAATSFPDLVNRAGQALQAIEDSRPAARAAAVAREIVRNDVDLVGLQEAVIVRTGPFNDPVADPVGAFQPETAVKSDNLQLLLKELQRLGEPFHVVAVVPGLDSQLPTALGVDARLTVRSIIIARSRADFELSNVQVQGYLRNHTFTALGGLVRIPNARGWVSVDVELDGRRFRFATTHLEQAHLPSTTNPIPVQPFQAHDMINNAGNTDLPVIFVGDFNAIPGDSLGTYQRFINAGFVDAWARKRPGNLGFTCCQDPDLQNDVSELSQRIDLIFFRGDFRVEDIRLVGERPGDRIPPGLWPSDHAGVIATLRIPRR